MPTLQNCSSEQHWSTAINPQVHGDATVLQPQSAWSESIPQTYMVQKDSVISQPISALHTMSSPEDMM